MFANLAFKFLPVVGCDVLTILLHVSLRLDPVLEAFEVDVADGARALAGQDERVGLILL